MQQVIARALSILASVAGFGLAEAAPEAPCRCLLLAGEGVVEAGRAGVATWGPARRGHVVEEGGRLRTGPQSRAAVRLADRILLRLNENTEIGIEPRRNGRPVLSVRRGAAYYFSRETHEFEIKAPAATGAIRGTELHLAVYAGGQAEFTLFEGEMEVLSAQGNVPVSSGQQVVAAPARQPRRAAIVSASHIIQWTLYYPGLLDPAGLPWAAGERGELAPAIRAYESGDLPAALARYPAGRQPRSATEKLFLAQLVLAVGQAEEAERWLAGLAAAPDTPSGDFARTVYALRALITIVKGVHATGLPSANVAEPAAVAPSSLWLADSYYWQSRHELDQARRAAREAVRVSPGFGFGWARVAELEFGFGRTAATAEALRQALARSPGNAQAAALRGFQLLAENRVARAQEQFTKAIQADDALDNAWLGRGLGRIRRGDLAGGGQDLQVAALLAPGRSLNRSYLAKGLQMLGDGRRARKELGIARSLDARDPTPWLYSALLSHQENRMNEAVRDLAASRALNDNRGIYRSRQLLDQDLAVRGANLAVIYRDAGMIDAGRRAAEEAVSRDFASASAHLFLAANYAQLQQAQQGGLRYETPAMNELLLADLLAPVGAGTLSQQVSQQEYSRMFDRDGLGVFTSSEYRSDGHWNQAVSQYGRYGRMAYALDGSYQATTGAQPDGSVERLQVAAQFKQQLTAQDTIWVRAGYARATQGDLTPYYYPTNAIQDYRAHEEQAPESLVGYHREWAPGKHTLALAGRLPTSAGYFNPAYSELLLGSNSLGQVNAAAKPGLPEATLDYRVDLELYTAEWMQIWQGEKHGLIAGGRCQYGELAVSSRLGASSRTRLGNAKVYLPNIPMPVYFSNPQLAQEMATSFERASGYAYYAWRVTSRLQATAGLSYDRMGGPENHLFPPLSADEMDRDQVSPKAGLLLAPWQDASLKGAFTRSLGGLSYEQSYRLEPAQVAGFNQSYRNLIPEALAGPSVGARQDTLGLGLEQKLKTGTWLGVEAEQLSAGLDRTVGAFYTKTGVPVPGGTAEQLAFRENNLKFSADQLLGGEWALGAWYQYSDAQLDDQYPGVPAAVSLAADTERQAVLNRASLHAAFRHPCGFLLYAESQFTAQRSAGWDAASNPADNFWQFNGYVGYRFLAGKAEARLGLLNWFGQDYHLNPLNYAAELPRARTCTVAFKFSY